ncbi:ribosome small subunit-dependent GTPase A [Seonamhaeicola marinus]|uniref:Small ribosomal subunit biogenesis GTPase RsgA n=1 Tax=Seonamhaeicola marinus TaxID=1912246 RepID=A0A5D0HQE6_9FLAO|nr:ribosome small subunit-dependent GTPase A [Seonamhaeicola marinus]TYA71602.1 ribosome small subunit-dependent GTPase A [Seonamhaeicola marinus]
MKLQQLGYNKEVEHHWNKSDHEEFILGRVLLVHKDRYIVGTEKGDLSAEITGNMRYTATSSLDFPAVGDWVALIAYDAYTSIIHKILPRHSLITRKAAGNAKQSQVIGANIDYALIVQEVGRDFNINRIERYLAICNTSNIQPIVILNKIDLIENDALLLLIEKVKQRLGDIPILTISAYKESALVELEKIVLKGKTYCLLGSSGVGKSTLVNVLAKKERMSTKNISSQSKRGQHTTTHRELITLNAGGILIDTPGMREIGMDSSNGMQKTFEKIIHYSQFCKFNDCSHTVELGCAVKEAIQKGELHIETLENYLRLEREKEHFEESIAQKRKKDKDFGKMVKRMKNIKKR